jgi:hypothetical protein
MKRLGAAQAYAASDIGVPARFKSAPARFAKTGGTLLSCIMSEAIACSRFQAEFNR